MEDMQLLRTPGQVLSGSRTFCTDMETDLPSNRKWRDFKLNMCRTGSSHFKSLRFRTTFPEAATEHMQGLTCDHGLKHKPCVGVDAEGTSESRMSATYTTSLWSMLMIIAALLAGVMVTSSPDGYNRQVH